MNNKFDAQNNQKIFLTEGIRCIERAYEHCVPTLMSRAGQAVAEYAKRLCPDQHASILMVVGPGNNGGDAIVAAACLSDWGYRPTLLLKNISPNWNTEVQTAFQCWQNSGGQLLNVFPDDIEFDLVIDGLFGIGVNREIKGIFKDWIAGINQTAEHHGTPVLSIDIPSGLNADTGQVCGIAVHASETITFIGLKPGLLTADGPDYAGKITLDTLQTENKESRITAGHWIQPTDFQRMLPIRPKNTHKGHYGVVGVIGGNDGMVGAALLAGRAALKLGAGRVVVGLLAKQAVPVDVECPELMIRASSRVSDLFGDTAPIPFSVVVLGPGMGDLVYTGTPILRQALTENIPLILDADALNLIALDRYLFAMAAQRTAPTVITPHPGEAARLLQCSVKDIQNNRIHAAQALSTQLNCWVVLKGAGTVIAGADKCWKINSTGNPAMASAGMGDVLSGMIAAFIAQHMDIEQAISAAVCLHGAAADACVERGMGPIGLTASEVTEQARILLNQIY